MLAPFSYKTIKTRNSKQLKIYQGSHSGRRQRLGPSAGQKGRLSPGKKFHRALKIHQATLQGRLMGVAGPGLQSYV